MRSLVTVLLLLTATTAFTQRVRYKDLFPLMAGMNNQELKNSLKEYISEDMDHPNANFRLALVYESNYKTIDPLTQYDFVLANAEQAKLRFVKSKQLVDEREVNRNNEYYFSIFKTFDSKGKPDVPFSLVSKKIVNGYDSADIFTKRIPPIYSSFTKSVNYYDNAVKIFSAVTSNFLSLDDLYLYYDDDLDKQLETLRLSYDSARFFLDRYMALTKVYPIAKHKQTYAVRPIITYRLDGLTTSLNFLASKIELWDYEAWVTQVRKSVSTPISALRKNLIQSEEKLDQSLEKLEQSNGEGLTPIKLDKQLVFNLNNYDKQSLALALLEYKTFKQNWIIQTKIFHPDTTFSDRNAETYSALIYANRSADTLAMAIKNRLTPEKIGKHKEFFLKYYGNKDGLQNLLTKEKEQIDKSFTDYTGHLQSEVVGIATALLVNEKNKLVHIGRWNLSLTPTEISKELLDKGEAITLQNKTNPDGSIYITGVYKPDKKNVVLSSFLARINPDGRPAWFKNFEYKADSLSKVPDANNSASTFELTREGCALIIHTADTSLNKQLNTFIYFNDKGEEKLKIKLKETAYPRKLNYIEKTNSFVAVLKGKKDKDAFNTSEPMTIISLNALGDMVWSRKIDLAGTFNDMVNLNDGCMVTGNFMILKDANGKEYRTQIVQKESNPFVMTLNSQGDITRVMPLQVPRSVYIVKTVKVNDSSINLLGLEDTFESIGSKTITPDAKIIHFMINQACQKIYSNL